MHWENTNENNFMLPEKIRVKLYASVLKNLEMSQRVMREKYFLFFTS